MKRIVKLLFVGFVVISAIVAFVPSIVGISTAGLTGMTKAAADVALWLIPLGAGFIVVMMGVRAFSKGKGGKGRGKRRWGFRGSRRSVIVR